MAYFKPAFWGVIIPRDELFNGLFPEPIHLVDDPELADFWICLVDNPDTHGYMVQKVVYVTSNDGSAVYICDSVQLSNSLDHLNGLEWEQRQEEIDYELGIGEPGIDSTDNEYSASTSTGSHESGGNHSALLGFFVFLGIIGVIALAGFLVLGGLHVAGGGWRDKSSLVTKAYTLDIITNLDTVEDEKYYKIYYKDSSEDCDLSAIEYDKTVVLEPVEKNGYVLYDFFNIQKYRLGKNNDFRVGNKLEFSYNNEVSNMTFYIMFAKVNVINGQYIESISAYPSTSYSLLTTTVVEIVPKLTEAGEYYGYIKNNKIYREDADENSFNKKYSYYDKNIPETTLIFQPKNGYLISFKSFSSNYGSIACYPRKYNAGDEVHIKYTPNSKQLEGIYANGELVSTSSDFTYIMPENDVEFELKFK